MFKFINTISSQEKKLYNKILFLSRNKLFYTKMHLNDTFQNRINLIFLHISFIFIKSKQNNKNMNYQIFSQKIFDLIFEKIDQNMREVGYGDVTVNKNMKFLVKIFYNILLNCENYKNKNLNSKNSFLLDCLTLKNVKNDIKNNDLVNYFDQYEAFCLDLSLDNVLKGDLNFNYK
mgnify:CR=1 FL=1